MIQNSADSSRAPVKLWLTANVDNLRLDGIKIESVANQFSHQAKFMLCLEEKKVGIKVSKYGENVDFAASSRNLMMVYSIS